MSISSTALQSEDGTEKNGLTKGPQGHMINCKLKLWSHDQNVGAWQMAYI